ncbi:hypothetical protein M8818_002813 [Zalaria obscura]|uniref:Uncharacterized protein n=1 Tax=Zalaria obscura TaxID=2024903 RepID=A0ACC3SHJ1_9PEZI
MVQCAAYECRKGPLPCGLPESGILKIPRYLNPCFEPMHTTAANHFPVSASRDTLSVSQSGPNGTRLVFPFRRSPQSVSTYAKIFASRPPDHDIKTNNGLFRSTKRRSICKSCSFPYTPPQPLVSVSPSREQTVALYSIFGIEEATLHRSKVDPVPSCSYPSSRGHAAIRQ